MQRGFGVFWDYCAIHNPTVVFNGKRGVESHFRRWFICTNKRKQTKYLSSPLPFPRQSLVNTEVFSSALHLWAPLTKSYPVRKTSGKIKYKIHFSDLKKIFFFSSQYTVRKSYPSIFWFSALWRGKVHNPQPEFGSIKGCGSYIRVLLRSEARLNLKILLRLDSQVSTRPKLMRQSCSFCRGCKDEKLHVVCLSACVWTLSAATLCRRHSALCIYQALKWLARNNLCVLCRQRSELSQI